MHLAITYRFNFGSIHFIDVSDSHRQKFKVNLGHTHTNLSHVKDICMVIFLRATYVDALIICPYYLNKFVTYDI